MTKQAKRTAKRPDPAPDEPVELKQLSKRACSTLEKGLGSLDSCVEAVSEMLTGADYDKDMASHLAWMVKNVAQIMGEVRKLENDDRSVAKNLSMPLVIAFLKQLDPDDRARVGREMAAMDMRGGVLG